MPTGRPGSVRGQTGHTMSRRIDDAALALTAIVAVPALAHALELPGKLRLDERGYRIAQTIYYPGFTVVGAAEVAAPAVTLVALVTASTSRRRRLAHAVALAGLVGIQALFWTVTQPANREWTRDAPLGRAGRRFFRPDRHRDRGRADWVAARNRWEASHVARAVLAVTSVAASWIAGRARPPRRTSRARLQ